MFEIVEKQNSMTARIKVIGIGGGGGNAVNTMIGAKLTGVDFMVANTDAQSLEASQAPVRIQLGGLVTKGLGAGANPEIGRRAALEDQETDQGVYGRLRHDFYHRRHGRRHRHRRRAGVSAGRARSRRADRRRGDQAFHLRGQKTHAPGGTGHRRAEAKRRYPDRDSEPAPAQHRGQDHDHDRGVSQGRRCACFKRCAASRI